MHKSRQNLARCFVSQRLLGAALWLGFSFLWYPQARAQQQLDQVAHSDTVSRLSSPRTFASPSPISTAIEVALWHASPKASPWAQLNNEKNRAETSYWLNTLQASGGSAAGNATVLALFIAIDILPAFLSLPDDWVSSYGPLLGLLVLIPAVTTPLFMHLWSPGAKAEHWLGSGIASLLSTLIHLGLMVGLGLTLNNMGITEGLASTFYLLAPVGFISAVLLESMGTAAGYQITSQAKQRPQDLVSLSHGVNASSANPSRLATPLVSTHFSF